MKNLILIGNLKMNMDEKSIKPYLKGLKKISKTAKNSFGVCVPYVYLPLTQKVLKNSNVLYGVQNMNAASKGAYTGEISANMLKDFNTQLVIIGHSERRGYYAETNKSVNQKLLAAFENNLTPIMCVGETKEERDAKKAKTVIKKQIVEGLKNISCENIFKMFFAYEPVWAIGTGVSATSKDAQTICKYIKDVVMGLYNLNNSAQIKVLYGGSLNEKNANELLSQPNIDGGLIGGACLTVDAFKNIINTNIEGENE